MFVKVSHQTNLFSSAGTLAKHALKANGPAAPGGIGQYIGLAVLRVLGKHRIESGFLQIQSELFDNIRIGLSFLFVHELRKVFFAKPKISFTLFLPLLGLRSLVLEPGYLIVIGIREIRRLPDKDLCGKLTL